MEMARVLGRGLRRHLSRLLLDPSPPNQILHYVRLERTHRP
jgi:hypothetical protein